MPFFLFSFLAWTPTSCQNQKMTTLVVNLATFWCINFKNKQTNKTPIGSFYTYSLAPMSITSDTYELCRPAALHPISCLHITSKNPDSSSPALSLHLHCSLSLLPHHLHPSISCRSLSAGLGLLCARHTWAVASVWKWGSFAFKHSALWALGKLDERRMRGSGGEEERTRGSGEREVEREKGREQGE